MKILLTITALSILALPVLAQDTKQNATALSWMSGCWETTGTGLATTERWGKATDNLLIGTSQTVRGTKSVAFEFLRVINNGNGLIYVAQPSSAKESTSFPAVRMSANEVVFENPTHDFPQRVIYRLDKPDSLFARIEGKQGEKEMGIDFPMKKVPCN
ncbi:MAG: DUF6265 family protein [Pyrinomonadaceae bacterium]